MTFSECTVVTNKAVDTLKNLADHDDEVRAMRSTIASKGNGIACPQCGFRIVSRRTYRIR